MTHDEYMALTPQTKYQIEKEKRQIVADAMTEKQLTEARAVMDEGKEQRSGRRKKVAK